jgi:thiol-disulfide isomerase/thioredoxin
MKINIHLKQLLNGILILFWMIIYWLLIGLVIKCFPNFNSAYHSELFHVTVAISIIIFLVLVSLYYRRSKEKSLTYIILLASPYFVFWVIMDFIASNLPRITDLFLIAIGISILYIMEQKNIGRKQKVLTLIISCLFIIPVYYFIYDNIWYLTTKNELQTTKTLDNFNFRITNTKGNSYNLADLEGKTVCVDMWASSCGNCISAMPDFEKLNLHFRSDTNYKIISLFCPVKKDQTYEWFQDYINRKFHYDIDYYYIDFETFQKLKIRQFPEFLLISKKSNLTYRGQISYLPYVNDNIYVKLKSINENY